MIGPSRPALLALLGLSLIAACSVPPPNPRQASTGAGPSLPAPADRGGLIEPARWETVPQDPRLVAELGEPGRRLLPLFAGLAAIEAGTATKPLTILQLGDSHTANYSFDQRLRELFQARFGAAGRGMLAAGIPHGWYKPQMVDVTEAGNWQHISSATPGAAGLFGLPGTRLEGRLPDQHITLASRDPAGFDRVLVEIAQQPGGGSLEIQIDQSAPQMLRTEGAAVHPAWYEIPTLPGSRRLTLTPHGDGPVQLLSWTTERRKPGILVENFGTIGATIDLLSHWDIETVATDLSVRQPALIIVAFGTNEGFGPVDAGAYQARYAERVGFLQRAAPNAAILVIGPTDGNRRYRRPPGQSGNCVTAIAPGTPMVTGGPRAIWAPPPGLALVRAAERADAARYGWYYWDFGATMGGACSMDYWTRLNPPLAHDDHVHLTEAGYRLGAEKLFAELMAYYDRYRIVSASVGSSQ